MLFAVALLAFASLGLPDGVLGVAWPSMRATFGLPPGQLGALLSASMVGYLASSFASGWIVARLGVGRLLVWSSALMVVSSALFAVTPRWSVVVTTGVLAGLGAGAIDAGINAFAASQCSPRRLSWLHAAYGVGAMLGPLLITATMASGASWRLGYALLAVLLAGLTLAFTLTRTLWTMPSARGSGAWSAPDLGGLRGSLARPAVWLNVTLFFVYTGIEASAGQWTYSLFVESRGVPPVTAGIWVAGYWGALTLGRLLFGGLAARWPAPALLHVAAVGAPAAALLLWIGPGRWSGPVGLLALGTALAPIFPLLVAGTAERVGEAHTAKAVGVQVAAAYLGAAALPSLAGVLALRHGLEVIGPYLSGATVLLLTLHALASRRPAAALTRPVAAPARG